VNCFFEEDSNMPDFQNYKRAILCEGEPDYVPAAENGVDPSIKAEMLGRPIKTIDDEAEFALAAGYDTVPVKLGIRTILAQGFAAARQPVTGKAGATNSSESGTSEKARYWADEGSGRITDDSSFENFEWPSADQYRYEDIERLGRILPAEAKVTASVGYIFAGAWQLMGFERFCLDLAEGGKLVKRVIQRIGEHQCQVIENALQCNCVGAISMPDDMAYTTSLMVKPSFLRQYVFPWHKKIGDMARAKGVLYLFHSDGNYLPVMDDVIACGYHAIHPCEPASMDIVELKRRYHGRLCLCGNINLDSTLTLGTPQDVEEEVKLRIRTVAPGGGYVCGSSNSVTDYVPFDNYIAMLQATRKYGKYPIRI
jgi:uroporphyrinogen decarboxylase